MQCSARCERVSVGARCVCVRARARDTATESAHLASAPVADFWADSNSPLRSASTASDSSVSASPNCACKLGYLRV